MKKIASKQISQMDILSAVIWFYLLREYLESKMLFVWDSDRHYYFLDKNLIEKSRVDAVTFGEAMYQLIENACVHSSGHRAWFGIRVHKADRQAPISELEENARKLANLGRNYQRCYRESAEGTVKSEKIKVKNIFNTQTKYFFEFYVVDCAYDQEGILVKYNNAEKRKLKKMEAPIFKALYKKEIDAEKKEWEKKKAETTEEIPARFTVSDRLRNREFRARLWSKAEESIMREYPEHYGRFANTIADIFTRKIRLYDQSKANNSVLLENHLEDISNHYGLRLYEKIVRANSGYLMCQSPNGPDEFQKYYNNRANWRKNRTIQDASDTKNTYATEFYAIVPLEDFREQDTMSKLSPKGGGIWGDHVERTRKLQIGIDIAHMLKEITDGQLAKVKYDWAVCIAEEIIRHICEAAGVKRGKTPIATQAPDFSPLNDAILTLNMADILSQDIETVSKAIFRVIAKIHLSDAKKKPVELRMAICFSRIDLCSEFLRVFSAFYINDQQQDMSNTQIAICSVDQRTGLNEVNFILAGENMQSVVRSAWSSVYFGSCSTLEYLPVLRYLSASAEITKSNLDQSVAKNIPLFPFDLYLSSHFQDYEDVAWTEPIDPWRRDTWFLKKMDHILNADLQEYPHGCAIKNLHIRLGSKLHLETFYEAQLLFHDSSNIFRFAYLLVQDLLYGKKSLTLGKDVLLVGYEHYTSQLVQQIAFWLNQSKQFGRILTSVIHDGRKPGEVDFEPMFDMEGCYDNVSILPVFILPVGSTMSTIFKMQHAVSKNFTPMRMYQYGAGTSDWNYCLVPVNQDLMPEREILSAVTKRYWETISKADKTITVITDTVNGKSINVRYLLPASAEWLAPDNCNCCRNNGDRPIRPLISVSKEEVIPVSIFLLRDKRRGRFRDLLWPVSQLEVNQISEDAEKNLEIAYQENNKRIEDLFGFFQYSHLYGYDNHFQFSINYEGFYRAHQSKIQNTVKTWTVDKEAYHVLISPLRKSNVSFIQDVLDYVFLGQCQFIHLDFTKTYREEVRVKYSHIAQDLRTLRKTNPKAKIYFHFADVSIVSGNMLNRARIFAEMLLEEAGVSAGDTELFQKIFLMINRSSFDTINAYITNPHENLNAYFHMSIPSYNISNGECPACKLVAKYGLLKKRSSTENISKVFLNLEEKHKKRTPVEYSKWLKQEILCKPSYLSWLKEWLYVNVQDEDEYTEPFIVSFAFIEDRDRDSAKQQELKKDAELAHKIKMVILNYEYSVAQESQKESHTEAKPIDQDATAPRTKSANGEEVNPEQMKSIQDFALYVGREKVSGWDYSQDFGERAVYMVIKYLVDVRNYMRLFAMNESYLVLEDSLVDGWNHGSFRDGSAVQSVSEKMLICISNRLKYAETYLTKQPEWKQLRNESKVRLLFTAKMEWLISYIKVMSREHIANHYIYRKAIVNILHAMRDLSVSKELFQQRRTELLAENNAWETILDVLDELRKLPFVGKSGQKKPKKTDKSDNETIAAQEWPLRTLIHFQFAMTLHQRLADLQIREMIDTDNIIEAIDGFKRLQEKEESARKVTGKYTWIDYPSSEEAIYRYMKSLKMATMTVDDDIPCLELAENVHKMDSRLLEKRRCGNHTEQIQNLITIGRYIYLENIRMLYSGMQNLQDRLPISEPGIWKNYRPADQYSVHMKKINAYICKTLLNCYANFDGSGKEADLLYQNPLSTFCRYIHKSDLCAPFTQEELDGNAINQFAYILQYFLQLEELSQMKDNTQNVDDLPYRYEELCRSLCGIGKSKMCYLLYSGDGNYPEIFAQSGYHAGLMIDKKILNASQIDRVLQAIYKVEKSNYNEENDIAALKMLPGVFQVEWDEMLYLVLRISIRGDYSAGKQFYIVLQDVNVDISEADHTGKKMAIRNFFKESDGRIVSKGLQIARNILFMRETVQEVLSRDYTVLANLRFDCSYVRPFYVPEGETFHPTILHLSDIHIYQPWEKYSKEYMNYLAECIKGNKATPSSPIKVDLIAITGDIADGRNGDGIHLNQNYQNAEKLLDEIVIALWKDADGYLPHDWHRRIMITTGNHDYATMNQFKAELMRRSLTVGRPVEGESSTMAKFSYFIDFLIRYLDPPIDKLIANDLNEIRYYRKLNIKVLMLNCSSKAVPRRTNKLGPDYQIVETLINRRIWDDDSVGMTTGEKHLPRAGRPFKICLAHYSDSYELEYFEDNYDCIPGWDWNKQTQASCAVNNLVQLFREALQLEAEYRLCKKHMGSENVSAAKRGTAEQLLQMIYTELQEKRETLSTHVQAFEYAQTEWIDGKPATSKIEADFKKTLPEDSTKTKGEKIAYREKIQANELYKEIKYYYSWLQRMQTNQVSEAEALVDERISRLVSEINESLLMSNYDKQRYRKLLRTEKENGQESLIVDLLLAGHIHAYDIRDSSYVADKMLPAGSTHVNGYVFTDICIDKDGKARFTAKRIPAFNK